MESKVKKSNTGCFKSLGNILTINISKTIKDIKTHLVNSESVLSQILHEMFKDAQCEHHWSHDTHQAYRPIFAKRVFCAMSEKAVYGQFFFETATVNGETYLDMLKNWLMNKLSEKESVDFIF